MSANSTAKIHRAIQFYAITTVILIAIIISYVSVYPLYSNLRDTEQRDLIFARDTSVLIVDEYVSRIKDITKQISSRTKAKLLLEEYGEGKISKAEMQTYLRKILNSALKSSTQLISITRINNKGEMIAQVGKYIPKSFFPKDINNEKLKVYGPFFKDKHYYLTIYSPIKTSKYQKIGADITLFDITDLQSSIHQKMQHRLGEILIAYIADKKLKIFSPIDTVWRKLLTSENPLVTSLSVAINHKDDGITAGEVEDHNVIIAYAPIQQTNWGIAVVVKKSTLFASIRKVLWLILLAIVFVTIFFVIGLRLRLKPLSGRIIMEHQELEDKLKKNRIELDKANAELQASNNKLKHLINYDHLTQILNRAGFTSALEQEISRAKRQNYNFVLLFLDLNDFKKINDEKGHEAGDIVLKTIAERLSLSKRKEDIVARLGGDEFAMISTHTDTSSTTVNVITNKIKDLGNIPITIHDQNIFCKISIGAALYPRDGKTSEELLRTADKRMYIDKQNKS